MTHSPSRRHALTALGALGGGALLTMAGCGGSIYNPFVPKRIISIGDALSDVGQTGMRWTVNDGSKYPTLIEQLVYRYKLTITPSSSGGTGYAWGGATITGGANSLTDQVNAVIAAGIQSTDLVVIQGGTQDIVNAFNATGASAATRTAVCQAAKNLAALVKKLAANGVKQMLVMGVYNLGMTPWAASKTQTELDFLTAVSIKGKPDESFNNTVLHYGFVGVPRNVVFFDIGNAFVVPTVNAKQVCATPNASTCTKSTLAPGVTDPNAYFFADSLYLTPNNNRYLGDQAYVFTSDKL